MQPQFTGRTTTRAWVLRWVKSLRLAEKDDDSVINSLEQIIPGTAAEFDFNHQRLNLSIPQIALYRDAKGYASLLVGTMEYQRCLPTTRLQVLITVTARVIVAKRQYLNMQNGVNFGPCDYVTILRGHATIRRQAGNTISSYLTT
ncbi:FimD/PapC N-terminal domain-containing protein [Shigella flexneri]